MENILDNINKASLKLLSPITTDETYSIVAKEAAALVKAEYGSIFLENQGEFQRVYATEPILYKIKPHKRAFLYKAFKMCKAFVVYEKDIININHQLQELNIKSIIYVPLAYKTKAIGVLTVYSRNKEQFNIKDLEALKLFGSMANLAIKKAQLHDETQKALETSSLFISMAAHELRTPLTTIHGYAQLLQSRLTSTNTTEAKWVEKLSWETYRLSQLINELLAVNRIKTGKLQYTWKENSLSEIINRVIEEFRFAHPERTLSFENKLSSHKDLFIGDFDKLLQVFTNLLDNAAKFSHANASIILNAQEKGTSLLITISDQGKGIPKKDVEKIFQGYYKGNGNTEEGMGLGLYLAQHIINQHKGTIKIKSKIGKGTTVEISLPKAKVQKA